MSVFNSISARVLLILIMIGILAGLAASSTDIFNPNTSRAEAERIRAEIEHQRIMNTLEEQKMKAQVEAEIAAIQRQQAEEQIRFESRMRYLQQRYQLQLEAYQRLTKIRDLCILILVCAASLGMIVLVVARRATFAYQPQHQRVPVASLRPKRKASPAYGQMRIQARQRELFDRYIIQKRLAMVCNGHQPAKETSYDKLPLAM